MADRFSSGKNRKIFALTWKLGFLLSFLGMLLSACNVLPSNVTILNLNCTGSNVSCRTPSPTPNLPAIAATVDAITKSQPLLSDTLSKEDNNKWRDQTGCSFHDGAYFVTYDHTPASTYGCDSDLHYGNVAIQMDVTLISGDTAGIIFRVDPTFSEMYAFDITNQREAQLRVFGENGATHILIPATANSAIHGAGEKNTLLVVARDSDFQLFVNGTFVGEAQDSTLTTGSVGMSVSDYSESAEASFSNLVIYQV